MDTSLYPQGKGYGSLKVGSSGAVSLVGVLPDGTTYTSSGWLAEASAVDQTVSLYQSLYRGSGSLALELAVDRNSTSNANSDVLSLRGVWVRPELKSSRSYKAGWVSGLDLSAIGTRFTAPDGSASLLKGLSAGSSNAQITFKDGKLSAPKTVLLDIGAGDVLTKSLGDSKLSLSIGKADGIFTGFFTHTDGKSTSFKGILLQKGANARGFGFFMNSATSGSESGGVTLSPTSK
jgi:hypothetical protein